MTETWIIQMLHHVIDIEDIMLVYEFAKSRGCIHFHSVGFAKDTSSVFSLLDEVISNFAYESNMMYLELMDANDGSLGDNLRKCKSLEEIRDFLLKTNEEKYKLLWEAFESQYNEKKKIFSQKINNLMTAHLAVSAMHIGVAPSNWLRPGGTLSSGYRQTDEKMLHKTDVISTHELKRFKFEREHDLFHRKVNITNHCFLHSCSDYCWRPV
jgi:DNA-directed RNA polymerase beta' subunit